VATDVSIVHPPGDMSMEIHGTIILRMTVEERRTRRKTCPSVTLSTTNSTFTDPGRNPDLRGDKPATNRLRYGKARSGHKNCVLLSRCVLPVR
jgi:hypothetical protein